VIGKYPTPVELMARLSTPACELWVKRDDLSNDVYGGNKVRKLERILESARSRGARRLLTFGTAGSHQALATAVHGKRAGFEVAAVLAPQPRTEYAVDVLRAALASGLEAVPASSLATVPFQLARVRKRGDFFVDAGGSSVEGTLGYVDAAFELEEQVQSGALPRPDAIVVPLGSAGTAAGLAAGIAELGVSTRVVAVRIVGPALMGKGRTLWLAGRAARRRSTAARLSSIARVLELERGYLGRGYGYATEAAERATATAAREGISLDVTYTAKTFAAALDLVAAARFRHVLFWHTLSSTPLGPLLEHAPALPAELDRLFVRRNAAQ
jgi:D-cysteine desulfhydrase